MPAAPPPGDVRDRIEFHREAMAEDPDRKERDFLRDRLIEVREVDPQHPLRPTPKPDANLAWIRAVGPLPDDPAVHHCALAYASDMGLLSSGGRPHGLSWTLGHMMGASLDHAMWFHGALKIDEWHLYSMDAPFTGGARAFNRGSIYTQDGRLAVSVAQEGLMRPIKLKG